MQRLWLLIALFLASIVSAHSNEFPVHPYVDPAQLDVPWPKHSHYKQPWRAWMETRSGYDFLRGIGINYNVQQKDETAIRLLAETGFRTFRLEVPWTVVLWDETGLANQERLRQILKLFRQYQIRPTILLNANHVAPGPVKLLATEVTADAPKGSRSVYLKDLSGIGRRTGISNLSGYWAAEAFITNVVPFTRECSLSKPLPKELKAGTKVSLATLKYLPLYPIEHPEFEETAAGWVRYAVMVVRLVREAGFEEFDVEIWNELTFGARFLDINNYYQPPIAPSRANALLEGGRNWELAKRTITAIKQENPRVRCIWGFSNTTFFRTGPGEMPPSTDGQSFHPYGTGTRRLPEHEYDKTKPERNLEGFTPTVEIRMPEGWAHTFLQTESLMRLINPKARERHPAGTERFYYYMTEHGVGPPSADVKEENKGWELKAKCALRSFCLWLHKGVDVLHYFSAYENKALGMGVLPPDLAQLSPNVAVDQVATLPMKAIRNLTGAFAESVPLETTSPLAVEVVALGEQGKNFEGSGSNPPLWQRDCLAVLPFQVTARKHVIAVYVMTWDATRPFPEQRYRLTLRGFAAAPERITLTDPLQGRSVPVEILMRQGDQVMLELPVTDSPRLLSLTQSPS